MPDNDALRLHFDVFELDEAQARLTQAGRPVALPPKAFGVLCALARQPGQLIAKDALLDAVWGHRWVTDSVLKTTISELRAALGDDARQPRFIETVSRRGYRFMAAALPVTLSAAAAHASQASGAAAPAPEARLPLIGRGGAMARLHAAWQRALAGRRQVVWLTGEAGIGKTTLIEHALAQLGASAVAQGQCVEQHGVGEPYLPLLEALGRLCHDDAAQVARLRAVAPTWLLQMPWLCPEAEREALRREVAGSGQDRMLRELGELLERCTADRPLLLVTEDLHWSDVATLQALDHVARRRGPARLMWLASFRAAEVIAEDHPLKHLRHELRLHRLCEEIALEPFSEQEVGQYLAQRMGPGEVLEPTVRALHARTDGLPLFLAGVVDELLAQGGLRGGAPVADPGPQGADATGLPPRVPESLAGIIGRRIGRLSAGQRALLEAASVCGLAFSAGVLAELLERDADKVADACDELARAPQWLQAVAVERLPDGTLEARYAFGHALVRQVLYQHMGALMRARQHRRVAEALERRRAAGAAVSSAELASHRVLSHDLTIALGHYADAAESALRHFAPGEALQLTAQAQALLPGCPPGAERDALELALLGPRILADSQLHGVTADTTRAACERVEALYDAGASLPAKTSRALEAGLGWVWFVSGEYGKALALAERMFALAAQRGDALLHVAACHLGGATMAYQGRLAEARQRLEQGLAASTGLDRPVADALAVVDLEVSLRAHLSQVLAQQGLVDQAGLQIAAARQRADRLGYPYARRLVYLFEAFLAQRLGLAGQVLDLAQALQQLATQHAIVQAEGPVHWLRGWALAQLGQPLEGQALILDGYARDTRLGMRRGRSGVLGCAADAWLQAGHPAQAQAQLDEAFALAGRIGERLHTPDLLLLRGRIALAQDDTAAARQALQAAWREACEQQAWRPALAAAVALCGLADAQAPDFTVLAQARSRVAEGTDSALAQHADALLQAVRRAPGAAAG
jgi:DNA-binding winged helix-turn-helix (wHTH) protein/type II secretory pathway predicted ATPase ExeA